MKVIYSDIDGTLYDTVNGIHKGDIEAIEAFVKQGNHVVLVSGRNPNQIEIFLEETGLKVDYVFGNGAGYCLTGQLPVYKHFLDHRLLKEMNEIVKREHVFYHYHTTAGVILEPIERYQEHFKGLYTLFEPLKERGKELIDFKYNYFNHCLQVDNPYEYILENEITVIKLEFMEANSKAIKRVTQQMEELGLYVYSSFMGQIEVVPKDCNKATMIHELNRDLKPSQTIGFGDASNDISLFEAVDIKVAVANATKELKQLSDVITLSCEEGGVGEYIRSQLLSK